MSRHELTPRPEYAGNHSVVVGWDEPLNTFFAQVWQEPDDPDDDPTELLWIGGMPGEIHDHEKVIAAVRPYAVIPATLAGQLYGEAN